MRSGDNVVYVEDPLLYGAGVVQRPTPKGYLVVTFVHGDEVFHPHELELLAVWLDEPVRA
jgi:hypothetical protein